jgi:hypothetical protein
MTVLLMFGCPCKLHRSYLIETLDQTTGYDEKYICTTSSWTGDISGAKVISCEGNDILDEALEYIRRRYHHTRVVLDIVIGSNRTKPFVSSSTIMPYNITLRNLFFGYQECMEYCRSSVGEACRTTCYNVSL